LTTLLATLSALTGLLVWLLVLLTTLAALILATLLSLALWTEGPMAASREIIDVYQRAVRANCTRLTNAHYRLMCG
jgi:hypothetical protein